MDTNNPPERQNNTTPNQIKPYTSVHELDSINDEPDIQTDALESAPSWAFLSFVSERDELLNLFEHLNPSKDSQRITSIVQQYQEQPQLLDPHLSFMTNKLLSLIREFLSYHHNKSSSQTECSITTQDALHLFHLVYTLTKVRGYKTISKLFPHSVEDLEPTFNYLEQLASQTVSPSKTTSSTSKTSSNNSSTSSETIHSSSSTQLQQPDQSQEIHPLLVQSQQFNALEESEWKAPYVLLLWLSVIGLIPFDLNALDSTDTLNEASSSADSSVPRKSLKIRMLDVAKHYLKESSITRNAASELLSTLLTRPDMKEQLEGYVNWSISTVKSLSLASSNEILLTGNQYLIAGLYSTLSLICQKGEREQIQKYVSPILEAFFPKSKQDESEEDEAQFELPSSVMINKKLSIKLVQRMALVVLKPMIPKWRYQRRTISLLSNLNAPSSNNSTSIISGNEEIDNDANEEEYDIPEEIEDFVHLLLLALRDKDTIVRWSAAKGIGRLTHRLPQSLADEIVHSLFDLFDSREPDSAWHGACLSVAELARRGLLLPERLTELLPKLTLALQYEIRRGNHTTGHHVRDAACYVAWALARAYDPAILRAHFVVTLASSLILTALFDKEVNCRRAAAAAFQEHVGRQGTFPHGIEIIGLVNFFTLSNRSESYLSLAPQIAQYEEYRKPIIEHLAMHKSQHVDHHLRELASKSLGKIATFDPSYICSHIIPKLVPLTTNADISVRQGTTQALAEIISSLALQYDQKNQTTNELRSAFIDSLISPQIQEKVLDIPMAIERARLYRGRGAEYLRIAVSKLIESISKLGLTLKTISLASSSDPKRAGTSSQRILPAVAQRLAGGNVNSATKPTKDVLAAFVETLEENLRHPSEDVVAAAVQASKHLAMRYMDSSDTNSNIDSTSDKSESCRKNQSGMVLIERWIKIIQSDPNPASRRGHSLALGSLPSCTIREKLSSTIQCLLDATAIRGKNHEMDDAEVRRNAVIALGDIVSRFPFDTSADTFVNLSSSDGCSITIKQMNIIVETLFRCMDDYTTDNRGDIGSIIREAAIAAILVCVHRLANFDASMTSEGPKALSTDIMTTFVCRLIKQSLEKIDRTRDKAGRTLENLLCSSLKVSSPAYLSNTSIDLESQIPNIIPYASEIWDKIEKALALRDSHSVITNSLNWASSRVVFPILVPLMKYDEYRNWVLSGIIRSVGGMNNSKELVDDATNNLLDYLNALESPEDLNLVATGFLDVMKSNVGNESVITSLWITLELLFSSGLLYTLKVSKFSFANDLLALTRAELKLPSTIAKLSASISIYSNLLGYEEEQAKGLRTAALKMMLFFLGYKYPVIRKSAAEALYLQLETCSHIITDPSSDDQTSKLEKAKEILTTVPWAWETDFLQARDSLYPLFSLEAPTKKA